jgi:carbamoyl-phosphate synthase small subunit
MQDTAYLVLENGTVFEGRRFGADGDVVGEIVFTTAMTGYLETLTDQSYHGQIVMQTFPLIGNYGVIPDDFESRTVGAKAYIVKYPSVNPSNFRSEDSLDGFLKSRGIIGIHGIDTRRLTKIIRENGVMNGKITAAAPTADDRDEARNYAVVNPIAAVSGKETVKLSDGKRRVALMNFGAKQGITNSLMRRGCEVWSFPYNATADDIIDLRPAGIMLSNGPGDPADPGNAAIVDTLRKLIKTNIPIFGICMGHQLLALANGYKTTKLKFGHRGANQPVKELSGGRVHITRQNHGYAVSPSSVNTKIAAETFVNVNDKSNEGLEYGSFPSVSVQFIPPEFIYGRFVSLMQSQKPGGAS